jgi:hypothetical protein
MMDVHNGPGRQGARTLVKRDAKGMSEQPVNTEGQREQRPSLNEARLRQQAIGVKLRQMFDEVVNEPVPDEFLEILRRADDDQNTGRG